MKTIGQFTSGYVFLSVLYVVIGLVLLSGPGLSVTAIDYGLGVIMIAVGITYVIMYFVTEKKKEGFLQRDLIIGIICLAFGVFVLLTPDFFDLILPFAVAVLLLVGAIVKIQNAVSMRRLMIRRWYLALIGALIIISLAIVLLIDPMQMKAGQRFLYIGICLVLDGVTNLCTLVCISLRSRKISRFRKSNPDADVASFYRNQWKESDAQKAQKRADKKAAKRQKRQEIVEDAKEVTVEEAGGEPASSAEHISAPAKPAQIEEREPAEDADLLALDPGIFDSERTDEPPAGEGPENPASDDPEQESV